MHDGDRPVEVLRDGMADPRRGVARDRVAWCIKRSDGCRLSIWTTAGLVIAVVSIVILTQAMRRLPASTSYAVWAGIGAAGTAILGMTLLRESVSPSSC